MKGILKFHLPEEQDEWNYAVNGHKYGRATEEVLEHIRYKIKREELSDREEAMLETIRSIIWEWTKPE